MLLKWKNDVDVQAGGRACLQVGSRMSAGLELELSLPQIRARIRMRTCDPLKVGSLVALARWSLTRGTYVHDVYRCLHNTVGNEGRSLIRGSSKRGTTVLRYIGVRYETFLF